MRSSGGSPWTLHRVLPAHLEIRAFSRQICWIGTATSSDRTSRSSTSIRTRLQRSDIVEDLRARPRGPRTRASFVWSSGGIAGGRQVTEFGEGEHHQQRCSSLCSSGGKKVYFLDGPQRAGLIKNEEGKAAEGKETVGPCIVGRAPQLRRTRWRSLNLVSHGRRFRKTQTMRSSLAGPDAPVLRPRARRRCGAVRGKRRRLSW